MNYYKYYYKGSLDVIWTYTISFFVIFLSMAFSQWTLFPVGSLSVYTLPFVLGFPILANWWVKSRHKRRTK